MKFLDYLSYLAVRAVYGLLRALPPSWVYAFARGIGSMLFRFDGKHRRIAMTNLRQAMGPQVQESQIRDLARQAFQHFTTVLLEGVLLDRWMNPQKWKERVEFPGAEEMRRILARGKGLLLLGPHFGNWEVASLTVNLAGFPNAIISRPLKNPYLVEYFRKMREAYGAKLIPRRGGFRELLPIFRQGGIASIMPDQNQRKRPIFVSWFGKLAATDRSPAFVALRLGVPVIAAAAIRQGREFRFRIEMEVVEPPPSSGDRDEDERRFAEHLHRVIERMILRHPEQYFWLHDRYRTRPAEGIA